jgi:hypothetical protein
MEIFKYIIFTFLLLISAQSSALNLAEINQPIEKGLYDNRSCNDLYVQATSLEKNFMAYEANAGSRTQVASIVSAVFAPAIYYLGYSAFHDYKNGLHTKQTFAQIEEVRYRMAQKRCFAK